MPTLEQAGIILSIIIALVTGAAFIVKQQSSIDSLKKSFEAMDKELSNFAKQINELYSKEILTEESIKDLMKLETKTEDLEKGFNDLFYMQKTNNDHDKNHIKQVRGIYTTLKTAVNKLVDTQQEVMVNHQKIINRINILEAEQRHNYKRIVTIRQFLAGLGCGVNPISNIQSPDHDTTLS